MYVRGPVHKAWNTDRGERIFKEFISMVDDEILEMNERNEKTEMVDSKLDHAINLYKMRDKLLDLISQARKLPCPYTWGSGS